MTRTDSTNAGSAGEEAARWFVRVDAGEHPDDPNLAAWLEARPENERALQRVELAAALGRQLAAEPSSALYAEAAQAARLAPSRRSSARALAWGGALAASLLGAVFIVRDAAGPARSPEIVMIEAARVVAFNAPSNPVAVLPNGIVVDASAVAVLPFTADDAAFAEGLQRDVAAALRTVPGLYVIADAAVSSYARTELSPSEIGGQLGARGIVDAAIELGDGRVRVTAILRETTTGATLWRTELDTPVDELRAVRGEIVERVAAAMLDASLRAPIARADGSNVYTAGKPLLQ
jgi:TolB-like protein